MPLEFAHCFISDEPDIRREMVAEIVKKHCTHIFFPTNGKENTPSHESSKNGVRRANHFSENLSVDIVAKEKEKRTAITNGDIDNGANSLVVESLSGGITNELFHVYYPTNCTHSVVFRVFGKETDRVISRESELFYQSFFIPTYVRGTNFLIYAYLNNHEALPFQHMPLEYEKIARGTAAFQVRATLEARSDFSPSPSASGPIASGSGSGSASGAAAGAVGVSRAFGDPAGPELGGAARPSGDGEWCRFDREENYTVHAFTRWAEQMFSENVREKVDKECLQGYDAVAQQLKEEVEWIMGVITTHAHELGEGVCHNDLLSDNLMRNKTDGSLKIIDFDYVKRNYLLFDLANHFNEYTGLECDYERYFPTDEQMVKFIQCYRSSMRELLESHAAEAERRGMEDIIPDQKRLFFCVCEEEEQRTVARWVELVKFLTLASHLSWSIWSLLQKAVSEINMDFFEYSKMRLARYLETKKSFSIGSS